MGIYYENKENCQDNYYSNNAITHHYIELLYFILVYEQRILEFKKYILMSNAIVYIANKFIS